VAIQPSIQWPTNHKATSHANSKTGNLSSIKLIEWPSSVKAGDVQCPCPCPCITMHVYISHPSYIVFLIKPPKKKTSSSAARSLPAAFRHFRPRAIPQDWGLKDSSLRLVVLVVIPVIITTFQSMAWEMMKRITLSRQYHVEETLPSSPSLIF